MPSLFLACAHMCLPDVANAARTTILRSALRFSALLDAIDAQVKWVHDSDDGACPKSRCVARLEQIGGATPRQVSLECLPRAVWEDACNQMRVARHLIAADGSEQIRCWIARRLHTSLWREAAPVELSLEVDLLRVVGSCWLGGRQDCGQRLADVPAHWRDTGRTGAWMHGGWCGRCAALFAALPCARWSWEAGRFPPMDESVSV